MTSSRGGMAKMTDMGRGSETPKFWMTSFVNAPLSYISAQTVSALVVVGFDF